MRVTAASYHLRYWVEEDRVLISADLPQGGELALPLTRRLTRNFLTAFAKFVAERARPGTPENPALRNTLLDFQHGHSVAQAKAEGAMKNENRALPQAVPNRPVHEVKLVPKPDGGLAIVFDNADHLLAVEVSAERIHMVLETFVQIAERAGWDFPPVAAWLDASKAATPKVVN